MRYLCPWLPTDVRRTGTGGRKKLVPKLDLETKCPHVFTEEDGLQLEVDCEACHGAQDIMNERCAAGIVHVFSSEATPATVVLKRHLHKRYRGAHVTELAAAASLLSALDRKIRSGRAPSDERCRTCGASEGRLALALRQRLLDDPHGFMADRGSVAERVVSEAVPISCGRSVDCLARVPALLNISEGSP